MGDRRDSPPNVVSSPEHRLAIVKNNRKGVVNERTGVNDGTLRRSVRYEFQDILGEGRVRYLVLVLEGRPRDKWVGGRFGSLAAEPPHSRESSYMNLLRAAGGGE